MNSIIFLSMCILMAGAVSPMKKNVSYSMHIENTAQVTKDQCFVLKEN